MKQHPPLVWTEVELETSIGDVNECDSVVEINVSPCTFNPYHDEMPWFMQLLMELEGEPQ